MPGSLNCIYYLAIAKIVVIKWKPVCFSRRTKIPIRLQCCLIDPAGNNTKSETGIQTMYANLFFLKYYIAYASVLLSKFRNHPVVFLVIVVSFTTIISVIRSITAYNYLSVLSSLLHGRLSVVTQRSFHWISGAKIIFSMSRKFTASFKCLFYVDVRVDLSPSWSLVVPWGLN